MQRLEYRNVVDKSDWPRGEWDNEPDKIQWQDEATGLPCLIVRNNHMGFLCGYVGILKSHPLYGKGYDDVPYDDGPHGGLTYANSCGDSSKKAWEEWRKILPEKRREAQRYPKGDAACHLKEWSHCENNYEAWRDLFHATHICHYDPDNDEVWWFGFDCGHIMDLAPGMQRHYSEESKRVLNDVYRNVDYVTKECRQLARQLKNYAPKEIANGR